MEYNAQMQQKQLEREVLLHRIANRIRQSLELKEILSTTTAEVRSVLGTDRVMVYRFHPDGSGKVIAESIHEQRLPSLLGLNFPADDIPTQARERFIFWRVRSIVDRQAGTIGWSPLASGESDGSKLGGWENATRQPIDYRPLDSCHLEYLHAMGVVSSLVVPISLESDLAVGTANRTPRLWGLLVSHHSQPRPITLEDLDIVQMVADRVSIAIAQSTLLSQARAKSQRELTVNQISTLLHAQPTVELQAALDAAVAALQGIGGRLYLSTDRKLFVCGEQPDLADSLRLEWDWLEQPFSVVHLACPVRAIPDLYQDPQFQLSIPVFQRTAIRGVLIVSLYYRQQHLGYLSIFRASVTTERLWAGRFNPQEKQLRPRRSFEIWRERQQNRAPAWTPEEVELAQALGEQFSMAIQQYQLYQQVRSLNVNLELQVQERTAKLRQALEFSQLRKQITDQIRSTLDWPTLLSTIVREVRSVLDTDRAVIYQIYPENPSENFGEVIVEDVRGCWRSVLGVQEPNCCLSTRTASGLEHRSDRLFEEGQIHAVSHVALEVSDRCYREFLQSLEVQACLVVPIRREWESQLWGLLIVHECRAPRVWQPSEIDLLEQLANQAAIAIGQAELYEQSQQATAVAKAQAQRAELALQELKQTQTQLIQSEKMSSLGQLVAGVAHEINNPVNFIYGNIRHTSEYVQDLMTLLESYRKHYPQPEEEIEEISEDIDLDFLIEDLPKMLDSMKLGADRIRHIVLSLRNFSRLDQAEMKPVDIHEGIDGTLLILQYRLKPKAERGEIYVVKDYGDLPPIECYAGQLNQVFMNLISNGIDALEEKIERESCDRPTVEIRTQMISEERVFISISDNGCGIPPQVLNRIFEPFFTTKPVGIGTGLGLSISRQIIVEKHGGKFECISKVNQGTQFIIEIPRHQEQNL
jgi:light-regulated signal transduction histidine kinase (bacteriophytochrome)